MTNTEPEISKLAAIPVQLCFFYNSFTKEILFSNSAPELFFETTLDNEQYPPFLQRSEGAETDRLKKEWEQCIELEENETRNFSVSVSRPKNPLTFSFSVSRPAAQVLNDASLLIISVTKTFQTQNGDIKANSFGKEYAEFIELAAHDLDSPLRKLSMLVDRMTSKLENMADKDMLSYTVRTRACLDDMRSMIDNLTTLAKLDGKPMEKKHCNINTIIESSLSSLPELIKEKIIISPGNLPVLEGDFYQYKLLFTNFFNNAWKFRRQEMPFQLEISVVTITDKEKYSLGLPLDYYCKITVSDNGIGFKQEYAEKIFQPFVRLNGKSEYPGNGIGLAIIRKVVENHCGIVYAESHENLGARFIMFLPVISD